MHNLIKWSGWVVSIKMEYFVYVKIYSGNAQLKFCTDL